MEWDSVQQSCFCIEGRSYQPWYQYSTGFIWFHSNSLSSLLWTLHAEADTSGASASSEVVLAKTCHKNNLASMTPSLPILHNPTIMYDNVGRVAASEISSVWSNPHKTLLSSSGRGTRWASAGGSAIIAIDVLMYYTDVNTTRSYEASAPCLWAVLQDQIMYCTGNRGGISNER